MSRYERNMKMLSKEENSKLKSFKVCVIGCGGLGGYIIEMLGRLGIGRITAVDGDVFDESNLNRQLLSNCNNLGKRKAMEAKERMKLVNPEIEVQTITDRITEENILSVFSDQDVIIDAVDNIKTRFLIKDAAGKLNKPMVHGAIAGWYGQVSTIFPGEKTLEKIYPRKVEKGIEKELGNPSFTPALVASIEVSEVLKILLGRGELLRNKVLRIDLYDQVYMTLDM
ncbi:HesA/MoeB/ThiF family protein [Clostridium sp. A1-XYC3]|uniref:HesA/MoeB/ThiF family protein n=1 Tax=Clostridium tanneri TaxID=3037988 RepID=A0ABU4JTC5_9CLOT|nr:HesA/MoeB/ThiF family protein [Clostridium sp. A1-XYC3]MDW8801390.1 HesA/MoeB/ThiF family protein [Clostridium sp. A1-XYC3]